MTTPVILCIDIETYGACRYAPNGDPLPEQATPTTGGRFHPYKSRYIDRPPVTILTCSVTEVRTPPVERSPTAPGAPRASGSLGVTDPAAIAEWRPGPTRVFRPYRTDHARWLAQWLDRASILLGHNLLFDLLYLRDHPQIRPALSGRQLLIDTMMLNYMDNESRDEKSLKALLGLFGLGRYTATLTSGRFTHPLDPRLARYNAEDTHATVLLAAELARRIIDTYPDDVPKLSAECLDFYSEDLWWTLLMSESGVPMSVPRLTALRDRLTVRMSRCAAVIRGLSRRLGHPLVVAGEGRNRSRDDFISYLLDEAPAALDHPMLERTEVKRAVSWNLANLNLFRSLLPPAHPARRILRNCVRHDNAAKLLSTYVQPLLTAKRNRPHDHTSSLLPTRGDGPPPPPPPAPYCGPLSVAFAYPNWFLYPSPLSDDAGSTGGVVQPRATCKNPAVQTFPPPVKACFASRHPDGTIRSYDLSQIELRVAALLSADPHMVAEYQKPRPDLHTDMAVRIMGADILKHPSFRTNHRDDPRKWAGKVPNFLILYRGRHNRLRTSIHAAGGPLLSTERAREIVASFPEVRPGLWAWQERLLSEAERRGFLYLEILGHSRTLLGDIRGELESTVCNFKVQSWAAVILRSIQHQILRHRDFDPTRHHPLAQIYDAIYFDTLDPPQLDAIVEEAVHAVAERGLWARLQDLNGVSVPLVIETD